MERSNLVTPGVTVRPRKISHRTADLNSEEKRKGRVFAAAKKMKKNISYLEEDDSSDDDPSDDGENRRLRSGYHSERLHPKV